MPLRVGDRVLVVKTSASPGLVTLGDWVAYQINTSQSYRTRVDEGYGVGEVLAVAGDKISFQANSFSVLTSDQ